MIHKIQGKWVYFSTSFGIFELYIAERVIAILFVLMLLFGSPEDGLGPQASLYRELLFIVYAITLYNKQTKQIVMLSIVGHSYIYMSDASWSLCHRLCDGTEKGPEKMTRKYRSKWTAALLTKKANERGSNTFAFDGCIIKVWKCGSQNNYESNSSCNRSNDWPPKFTFHPWKCF